MTRKNFVPISLIIIVLLVGSVFVYLSQYTQDHSNTSTVTTSEITITKDPVITSIMQISSPAFNNNNSIPSKYTCDGEDISPPLAINEVPKGAKSLVLIVDDPDAPIGEWVHWTVINIPPETTQIEEGKAPKGVEGLTDFQRNGWGGPCPPSGTHRYFFKLFALDTELEIGANSKKVDILFAIDGHIMDSAELIGLYAKN